MTEQQEYPPIDPGTYVVSSTRMPPTLQAWAHEIYVGIVQEPTESTIAYNRLIREHYPTHREKINVLYPFGLVEELVGTLTPITPQEAQLTFRGKIKRFMSEESLYHYDKCSRQLELPEEERI